MVLFDGNGRPVGIVVLDGQIISEPFAARTALGLGPRAAYGTGRLVR